jgi:hypothetical protein
LTIHNSTFTHNVAGSLGGGLRNNSSSSAPVTITGSTFDDNTIFGQGGGTAIENAGTMEVTDSTIFGNSARIPSSAESISNVGDLTFTNTGVIYNEQGIVNLRGSLELVSSYVQRNSPRGGIVNHGSFTRTDSNVSGNVPFNIAP